MDRLTQQAASSGILLFSCPDQAGIVAKVSGFLSRYNGNILSLEQHVEPDDQVLFMRVRWELASFDLSLAQMQEAFAPLAESLHASWRLESLGSRKPKIALMVSKHLHCLLDLLWRQRAGELACEFALIMSNHLDAQEQAKLYNIPYYHVPVTKQNKSTQEQEQIKILQEHGVELVVMARYMQILSSDFIACFPSRIINIHHSFLPAFVGGNPYKQALDRGVKIIGATSHYATDDLDEGPIIQQDVKYISHKDSLEDLVRKGKDLEKMVLAEAVRAHLEHRILLHGRKTIVFST